MISDQDLALAQSRADGYEKQAEDELTHADGAGAEVAQAYAQLAISARLELIAEILHARPSLLEVREG